jgi:glycosyltransferase involved in cell wall biosynthesis
MERNGGPSTYLYNLKQFVINNNLTDQIHFLSDFMIQKNNADNANKKRLIPKIKKIAESVLFFIFKEHTVYNNMLIFYFTLRLKRGSAKIASSTLSLNDYDYIHFHAAFDLCLYRKYVMSFQGKIILTSHCPQAPHLEYIEMFNEMTVDKVWKKSIKTFEWFEAMAFKMPDYIIAPCKEALEPYYNTYPVFQTVIDEQKLRYVPTGIIPATYTMAKTDIRRQYNIKDDEIVLSYVGRHNAIKGYDMLLQFGSYLLSKYDTITFLVAGKEYPMSGLKHKKWIEIGWTDDPHSIINASDLFVLPNRETYFDLILLEVMSLGKPVLLSHTGGNTYFEGFLSKGLLYFEKDNLESMIQIFEKNYKNYQAWNEYGSVNARIFTDNFTVSAFGSNYLEIINTLD